ncbi:DUF488 domain-containing protein [Flavihumibacter fluvii]|uniref:DUF488 domain-containing protein n=1 Tax=Flavihumibacter fluvii TaxID=2838157 RepID=UPI001BDF6B1A|nr:DUF488 domain-containing protein [Flavihumibacter fluvii]ULQ52164.1 DUF488 domain-containing protein [Flavihumibacter fluvii]
MFYRRKLILAILELFGGKLEKINLQKILFLICQKQERPEYDFIPYLYGCFSFSANADLYTMVQKGILNDDNTSYWIQDKKNHTSSLKSTDLNIITQAYRELNGLNRDSLMKFTYINHPYYAINSTTAERLLTKKQLAKVYDNKPSSAETVLYTIGYEGISLEAYLNKLIKNDIRVLVDVRNNPMSQKFGFSKSQLIKYCSNLNIEYIHFAEVGIQSEFRQELKAQSDYDNLFNNYRNKTLPKTISTQERILALLKENKRIALTCFEAAICQCHRKPLAEAISKLPGWSYELKHI